MSKESTPLSRKEDAKAFAKEHWPLLAAASTAVGACILLLIKYHRHRKAIEGVTDPEDPELVLHEQDAASTNRPHAPMFFETGQPVVDAIDDVHEIAQELAEGVETEEGKNWLLSLSLLRRK